MFASVSFHLLMSDCGKVGGEKLPREILTSNLTRSADELLVVMASSLSGLGAVSAIFSTGLHFSSLDVFETET